MTEDVPEVSAEAHTAHTSHDAEAGAAQAGAGDSASTEAATDGSGTTSPVAELADLEAHVAELERQLAHEREAATDYMNRWQRAQADFANFKRRAQQDQQQLQRALAAEAARLILPALDAFERAFATLPASLQSFTWINGIALVEQQLAQTLSLTGLQPIAIEPGQPFDPAKHTAIGEVETAEHPAGSVAVVVQRGYQMEGYLLRPALVQLAKAQAAESATASDSPLLVGEGPEVRSAESATASISPSDGDVGVQPAAPPGIAEENPEPSAS